MTLAYATSRLNGITSPANAAYSASELEFQMKNAGAKALFTVCAITWSSISLANHNVVHSSIGCCSGGCEKCWYSERASVHIGNGQRIHW